MFCQVSVVLLLRARMGSNVVGRNTSLIIVTVQALFWQGFCTILHGTMQIALHKGTRL